MSQIAAKTLILLCFLSICLATRAHAQTNFAVPPLPDPVERMANLKREWAALQQNPPQLGVRDCFLFLLDALDTQFLEPQQVEWVLKRVQTRMISNPAAGRSSDDKPFVIYLSSKRIPEMPNIAFVMEGRDDHYGTWAAEGMGEKMKHLIPANYPSNGGWDKARHLMPFMQSAQNKGEMVILVSGIKDHNCIREYLNSTIILPHAFGEIWLGNHQIAVPETGAKADFDDTQTLFTRFEDVVIAFRFLWTNSEKGTKPALYNDGFKFVASREKFPLQHNAALRITLQHPTDGKADVAMWWKTAEGIKSDRAFADFRQEVLKAEVAVKAENGQVDIAVMTKAGKLGVRADLSNKKRLDYYNPLPLPKKFLFSIDGQEIGKSIMEKYKSAER